MADTAINTSTLGFTEIPNFDLHDPRTLQAFADRYVKPKSWLKDTFFPTTAMEMFSTEAILLDEIKHSRKAAPFVISGSKDIGRDSFTTDEYTPPRIAPSRTMRIDDLKKRYAGEAIFNSEKNPGLRAAMMTIKDLTDLDEMITRREEIMCAETLLTNGCVMKHIDPDSENTTTHTLKFYDGVNDQIYTPSTTWSNPDADIFNDLNEMINFVTGKGNEVEMLLVGQSVADAIMRNNQVYSWLKNERFNMGNVAPRALPNKVTEICKLNIYGKWISVIRYSETYENDDGVDTPYIPTDKAILTAPGCGKGYYGGVTQLEDGNPEFQHYQSRRVTKLLPDIKKDVKKLQLVSRPLMVPVAKGGWITSTAIF
jgi:hypothetical protein